MKHFVTIGVVLAASQCPSITGDEEPTKTEAADVAVEKEADAGQPEPGQADTGSADTRISTAWLEPGPPPFDVPTKRIELPGLQGSIIAPTGTDLERTGDGVVALLGTGKNFWIELSDAVVDLQEVRDQQESETADVVDRWEDAVVWNEGEHWFFQYSGAVSCSNPIEARHDFDDVEKMIAACRSFETVDADSMKAGDEPRAEPETPN